MLDRSWSMAGVVDGSLQGRRAGGGRRDDRRAVARRPHVQRSVRRGTSRCATSARTATTSGRRSRSIEPGGHTLIFPGASSRRTSRCEPPRRARSTSSCSRTAGPTRTTTRGSSRRWSTRASPCRPSPSGRPPIRSCCATSRSGARDAPTGRRRQGAAADLRQGSARTRRRRRSTRSRSSRSSRRPRS